jgi:hypothetical protein
MDTLKERRKHRRIAINRPIFYTGKNYKGKVEEQGAGLALDISVEGMMFESNAPIDATHISIRAAIDNGDTAEVEGMLIYSMLYAEGKYRAAIRFSGEPDQVSFFFNQMCNAPDGTPNKSV